MFGYPYYLHGNYNALFSRSPWAIKDDIARDLYNTLMFRGGTEEEWRHRWEGFLTPEAMEQIRERVYAYINAERHDSYYQLSHADCIQFFSPND